MRPVKDEGLINVVISALTTTAAIATIDIQAVISCIAGIVAIISGFMAIRFYYYATKKENEK